MSEISRRTVLGAAVGTAATTTLLTAPGTAQAAPSSGATSDDTPHTTTQETDTAMAVTTEEQKYEAFVSSDEGEWVAHAVFDAHSDAGDMWAYVDAALARLRNKYPNSAFTGTVRRYDQVITGIAHP
ncbi:hypothetical protein [Streptomyces sp. NPDC058751]|uniref:hypothetical protein n=1 Tax=Streptomyces sp. NPDC058751 TaxID=3346623 RepID=UPI0036960785